MCRAGTLNNRTKETKETNKQKKEQKTKQNISKVQRNDLKTFTKTTTKNGTLFCKSN